MARIQKKRLDTPVNEGGWSIGLGGLKLGNLLGGLNLHTDSKGNQKLGGSLSTKLPGTNVSIGASTNDLSQWNKKKKKIQKRTPVQKRTKPLQKSSRELQGFN